MDDMRTNPFMPSNLFNRVVRRMDEYGKNDSFQPRFWEELEEALNETTTENFVIKKDSNGRLLITLEYEKRCITSVAPNVMSSLIKNQD